jgi:membrane associated rhomboid family serine protease
LDSPINYAKCEDFELIEIYGRLDPLRAPVLSGQVKEMLVNRGYVFPDGDVRLGYEILPSREKLRELIGVTAPIKAKVFFGDVPGVLGWLQPAPNDFNLVGVGYFEADGIYLKMYGPRNGVPLWIRKTKFQKAIKLNCRRIRDVEVQDNAIRLGYQVPDEPDASINLWFPDRHAAAQIADGLPKTRTEGFQPRLSAEVEYQEQLSRQPPKSTATLSLLVANVALFVAVALAGGGWIIPNVSTEILAGSNFGSLTTHGEWWRLVTALFVHFGILHLVFNMWALAAFGGLAERLLGIANFLFVYFVAGIAANLASITLTPDVNTAGASGAIFGILGAFVATYWRNKETLPFSIVRSEAAAVTVFAGFALLGGFFYKGVDNAAHVGGLVTGLLLGVTLSRSKMGPQGGNTHNTLPTFGTLSLSAAAAVLACGFWGALRAAAPHPVSDTHTSASQGHN